MSTTPEVSIVMANFNGARYLPAAIQSVLRQSLASWELIVVDDASTDDSIDAATRAAGGDPRVHILAQPANRGPGAARNRALDLASGRWIAVFDSDDLMLPHRLERMLGQAAADGAAIIADNLLVFSEGTRPRPFLAERLIRRPCWIDLEAFIDSNCLYTRSPDLGYLKPLIRADTLRGLRYDETLRIGEDYNFLVRLMAQGRRLRLDPTGLYLYRKHQSSTSHRLRATDIAALLDAEDRFAHEARGLSPRVKKALSRRQRTLRSLMVYDEVIGALKRADLLTAADHAIAHPHMWPLLARPISARLGRIATKLRPPQRENHRLSTDDAALQALLAEASIANVPGAAR